METTEEHHPNSACLMNSHDINSRVQISETESNLQTRYHPIHRFEEEKHLKARVISKRYKQQNPLKRFQKETRVMLFSSENLDFAVTAVPFFTERLHCQQHTGEVLLNSPQIRTHENSPIFDEAGHVLKT